jgi:cell division protein FtsI (penicillin-binding protein 3)
MHVASFAGIAPVNSPVIAIAVVLDDPKGGGASYYGGAASAPVFAQVAQRTLEYLNVPHDVEVHAVHGPGKGQTDKDAEPEQEHTGDVNALLSAVNDLPADDPLREAIRSSRAQSSSSTMVKVPIHEKEKKAAANSALAKNMPETANQPTQPRIVEVSEPTGKALKMPSLIGLPMRQVVEQAENAGLTIQVEGRGIVRSQEPAAGSLVSAGARVTVHCTR